VREKLHDFVGLQLVQRFVDPIVARECHVGIDPGDVLPVSRQGANADIDEVFFVPQLVRAAELHRSRPRRRDFEVPVTQRKLYCRQDGPGVGDVLFKLPE